MIRVGSRVRERITGNEGLAVGRTEWIAGAPSVGVRPDATPDDPRPRVFWAEEARLEVLSHPQPEFDGPPPAYAVDDPKSRTKCGSKCGPT